MNKKIPISIIVIIMLILSTTAMINSTKIEEKEFTSYLDMTGNFSFVPGEFIVKFKQRPQTMKICSDGSIVTGFSSVDKTLNKYTPINKAESLFKTNRETQSEFSDLLNIYKFSLSEINDNNFFPLMNKLQNDPNVEYVEPNYIYYSTYVPNDPLIDEQWYLENISAFDAWDIETGNSRPVIAIIDTGVDYTHEDISIVDEMKYDFVDIDVQRYNEFWLSFIDEEDYTIEDNDPTDYNGHGTHCAGIAAGRGNNEIGISGVCPQARIAPIRAGFALRHISYGEFVIFENDDIIQSIYQILMSGNVDVISLSFGGREDSKILHDMIKNAYDSNIVVVAAAGNSNNYLYNYPAAYDEVISVSATLQNNTKTSYSSFGSWIDVSAPGGDFTQDIGILSTVPTTGGSLSNSSGYTFSQGTSSSCPQVAGLAGLLKSKYPTYSVNDIKNMICVSSDELDLPYPDMPGAPTSRWGRINATKALLTNHQPLLQIASLSPSHISNQTLGEEIEIVCNIENIWDDATNIKAELSIEDERFIVDQSTATLNSITYGETKSTIDNPFIIRIIEKLPPIYLMNAIPVHITIESNGINNFEYDKSIQLTTESPMQSLPGWPVPVFYQYGDITVNPYVFKTPVIGDIDNDGFQEVIVYGNIGPYGGGDMIGIYRYDGTSHPGWPKVIPGSLLVSHHPILGDLNNDSMLEIILAVDMFVDPAIYIWKENGDILNIINDEYIKKFNDIIIEDIDNDGNEDIIVIEDCTIVSKINVFNVNGESLPGWPIPLPMNGLRLASGDLNNDGFNEIVVTNNDEIHIIDHQGNMIQTMSVPKSHGYPVIGNIDGDNDMEIIVGTFDEWNIKKETGEVYAFHHNGTLVNGWPVETIRSPTAISLADFDNDNYLEIIVGTSAHGSVPYPIPKNNSITIFNHKGETLPGWPVPFDEWSIGIRGDPIIGDINNDGKLEILATQRYYSSENNLQLFVWDENGNSVDGFPLTISNDCTAGGWGASPSLTDLDNDGITDMIIPKGDFGNIYAFNLTSNYDESTMHWPFYRYNNRQTSSFFRLFQSNAQGPYYSYKNYNIQFNDATCGGTPPYSYLWDFGDGETSTEKNPTHTYPNNGTYIVTLEVTDNNSDVSQDITTVYVRDSNSPPVKPYNPIPNNGNIDVGINKKLIWNCRDPDSDSMKYDIYFGTNENPRLIKTDHSITGIDVDDLHYNTKYYWKIVARDIFNAENTSDVWSFTTEGIPSQNNPPYVPKNPDPENREINVSIDNDLRWNGGDPDGDSVTYDVYFGTEINPPLVENKQSTTRYNLETLEYDTKYYWKIVAWDEHNLIKESITWEFTTEKEQDDDPEPIEVEINKPENAFYRKNEKRFPLNKPFIIGTIDIEFSVSGDEIDKVELYIDDELQETFDDLSYNWIWDEKTFRLRHTIKVIVYDIDGQEISEELVVRKFL